MGGSVAVAVGLGALSLFQGEQQREDAAEARRAAERQAALDREALAALTAEPAPAEPEPSAMPSQTSSDARRAKRASIASQMRRRGRQSTILTDATESSDVLGT